ncbi:vWA domain-containing protein [Helicobacter ganmani]|uniref:vWA domain-containing protein n=1 Tax=Helicobacter ganmani TaxID=60246 RepID=UPI003A85600C
MQHFIKSLLTKSLFCFIFISHLFGTSTTEIPEVDEKLIDTMLSRLIYGAKCDEMAMISHFDPSVLWVYDKDKINIQKIPAKIRYLRFAGRILSGGIASGNSTYTSADKTFIYTLSGTNLEVKSICDKQQLVLKNYDKEKEPYNLKLRQKGGKEIAIVINVANSMKEYVFAFKEIAPFIAKHILEYDKDSYSKITLVSFSNYDVKDYDDVFISSEFVEDTKKLKVVNSQTKLVNYALIQAMSHFTKDNGLKKEIFLITDGDPNDMRNVEKMLYLTKNLNRNIVKNSGGSKENWVTIHTLALNKNLDALKEITLATEGNFYEPSSAYEFKKLLLRLSNNGKDVEPREINVIVPSKTHKIYDPDNPDNLKGDRYSGENAKRVGK